MNFVATNPFPKQFRRVFLVQVFKDTATAGNGFGAAGFPPRRSGLGLSQRLRKLQRAILRAFTLPTWWEFL
jgi:hypothetical protein